ncbi:low-density lipoprotein receptor-related protein 12-like [Asterias rubens]|uniref:low-density lipoprotein receptor-related protein 12-like n=1 Tax=Asterias rubens TaxID=7604 RepID=UPI001455413D|nr:low-density lipoprotein receptor-related protein 12-like [Asterias rubens]
MDIFRRLSANGIGSLCTTILSVFLIVLSTATERVEAAFTNCSDDTFLARPFDTIKSPNYPSNYPNNAACKWHIKLNSSQVATIRFTDFHLVPSKDCQKDYVSISPLGINQCGVELPPTYISGVNTALIIITFRTDKSNSEKGFALEYYISARHIESCDPMTEFHCSNGNCLPLSWACNGQKDCFDGSDESPSNCPESTTPKPLTTVPWRCSGHEILCTSRVTGKPICLSESKKCDGHIDCGNGEDEKDCHSVCRHYYDSDYKYFTSPNFPNNYDSNLDCSWTLSVKSGAIIQLRFHTFNLEQGYDTDYVNVYDGDTEGPQFLIGNYYSYDKAVNVPPKVIDGTGNTMLVIFHTDASSNNKGFNVTYQTKGDCLSGQYLCSRTDQNCFDDSQKCDNILSCMKGQDEVGCIDCAAGQIPCLKTHTGCYSMDQRCDGKRNCKFGEDEEDCDPRICKADYGLFLCGDRKCMQEKYICDESTDCMDGSDEQNCYVSTKVVTAAAVGSIVCGLLLVAALSCTCKLYQLHVRDRFPPSHMSPLREIEEELLRREAPPSYTATMASPHFDEAQRAFIEGIQAAVIARNETRGPTTRQSGSRRQRGTFVRMLSRDRTSRSGSQVEILPDENTTESQTEMPPPSPAEMDNEVDTMMTEEEGMRVGDGPPPLRRISGERSTPTVSPSTVEASAETAGQQESTSSSVSDTDSETNQEALHLMVRAAANIRRMRLAGGLQNVMQAQDHRAARARSRTGSLADIENPADIAPSGDSAPTSDGEVEMVAEVGSSSHLNENTNNASERTDTENHSLPTESTQEAFKMSESSENPAPRLQKEPDELASDSESLPQDGEVEVLTSQSPEEAASCDDGEVGRDSNTEERLSQASSILSLASVGSTAAEEEDVPMVEP